MVAFLSTGGLVVAVFCTDFLIVGFSMLMLGRVSRNTVLNTCVAVVFLFGVRALAAYQVNENTIGLALSMGLLHLVTRNGNNSIPKAWAVAAAVILGHLVGIRPITLLLIPAALVLMRGSKVMRAIFVGSVLVAMSPWLVAHGQAFGNAVHHPALEYGHETQTLLTETPLEMSFTFHPLNYPFAEQWLRPPAHPYPTNLRLPLELLQALGAPFLALVICGCLGMWILSRRRDLLGLVLWILPVPLILGAI
ncbi:MAG TPA: hypothetical protein EYN66_01505, partial [Myxococcales bacterium]|nr:hypothetical protein [Myxococcales bacterium]